MNTTQVIQAINVTPSDYLFLCYWESKWALLEPFIVKGFEKLFYNTSWEKEMYSDIMYFTCILCRFFTDTGILHTLMMSKLGFYDNGL